MLNFILIISEKKIILNLLLFSSVIVTSQGSIYTNQSIYIDSGVTLYVEGNVQLETNNGSITNKGELILKEDWENNSNSIGLINNGKGKVTMSGDAQKIKGNSITTFYELELNGVNTVKDAEIKVLIDSLLKLNGAVMETNSYQVHLLNANTNAIEWNTNGYVSTQALGGQLVRNTNTTLPYAFPLGNNTLTHQYRVVEITPTSVNNNTFGAALLAESINTTSGTSVSGAIAPYNENDKEDRIKDLNTSYYHSVYQYNATENAEIKFYYFKDDSENLFTSVAQWKVPENQWIDEKYTITSPSSSLPNYGNPNSVASNTNVSNFNADIFTFVKSNLFIPNGFSPGIDGYNDFFVIENIEQYTDNKLVILNRWGNEIYKASPYKNTWDGTANSNDLFLQGEKIADGTYFYILKLTNELPVLKGFIEVKAN